MSSGENSGGLMSSAGLVRYFDAEDRNAIRFDPKTIVAWGVLFGFIVQIMNAFGGLNDGTGTLVLGGVFAAFVGLTVGLFVRAAMKGEV
jgi:preprotein translocase subunit Sec61beta